LTCADDADRIGPLLAIMALVRRLRPVFSRPESIDIDPPPPRLAALRGTAQSRGLVRVA
jgi:hypothetical protein